MKIKFAIIADIHFGPAKYSTPQHLEVEAALPDIVSRVVTEVNAHRDIEFVINLGDLVQEKREAPSRQQDLLSAAKAIELLKKLNAPVYHVVGNHDRVTLEMEDLRSIFGHDLYYVFESKEFVNIVLQCESPAHFNVHLVEGEMAWLSEQLSKAHKPVLIHMHQMLIEHPLEGTSCEGIPDCAYVRNKEEIRELLEKSGKVKAVFNGHMHHNLFGVMNQIPYFTVQAVTQPLTSGKGTAEAYAIVEIDSTGISVDIRGFDPARYVHRW